jgi:uncharacterized membrane protein YccC
MTMTPSTRTKNAIKPALAVTIAYGISLGMGWENPYWAGFAVAMISLSTAGQSLNKGAMRMLGTLVAATAALIFITWFVQDRWWFIGVLSVYIGVCTYMITGNKRQYFWYCCAFVCLVICAHAAGDATNAFDVAVLRVQQTGMGILVYTLVSVFLWPTSSRGMLDEATRKLFTTQATLYRTYRALLSGQGTVEDSRPLRMQEVQLLSQRAQALNAAETDSYEVWEVRHQWRRFHRLSTALMEALEQWRESFSEIQPLDLTKLLPNIETVLLELDDRFAIIERLLGDEAPTRTPKSISLVVDHKEALAFTHIQKAALAVTKTQLDRLEALSRTLFDCVRDIKGYDRQSPSPVPQDTPAGSFGLDPDRLQAAFRVMATLWAAFLIWFYIDPPGHESFVLFATIVAMGAAMAHLSPITLGTPYIVASLLAGVLYIFVMPHLSGYAQLGVMIFGAIFTIYYLFWQPRQGLAKSIGAAMFLNVIAVQNQQTYSFAGFANSIVMIALASGIAIVIWYVPPSPRPEKVFLRLLARFYRHSEHLISRMALDWEQRKGWTGRWKIMLYQNDLLELPQKLSVLGGQIDQRLFPANTPEQVQTMVNSLEALALRIKHLVDARKYPQASLLVRELLDDVRTWRMVIEGLFQNWSDDPASEPKGDLQNRLTARLKEMETLINRTLSLAEKGELSEEDYKNFYRLIGSYRGLSESVVAHAKLAQGINWALWKEARF